MSNSGTWTFRFALCSRPPSAALPLPSCSTELSPSLSNEVDDAEGVSSLVGSRIVRLRVSIVGDMMLGSTAAKESERTFMSIITDDLRRDSNIEGLALRGLRGVDGI